MKKRIVLTAMIMTVVALILLLTGCGKDYKVTKKGHDVIVDASDEVYIAFDDGKSYIYSLKNSKKLTKKGFDTIRFLQTNSAVFRADNYFLAYNTGDLGYSVINKKGDQLIVSTADMKIDSAVLAYNISYDGETPVPEEKFIFVNFRNGENQAKNAVFRTDGTAVFYDKNGNVEVIYVDGENDARLIGYVIGITYGTVDNVDNKVVRFEVFDGNLTSIYTQDFDKNVVYVSKTGNSDFFYVRYRKTANNVTDDFVDVFAGGKAYTGYTTMRDTLYNEKSQIVAYVLSTYNRETQAITYSIVNKNGVARTFADQYVVYENNIHTGTSGGRINVMNYEGATILSDVTLNGYVYSSVSGGTQSVYDLAGRKLFDTAATTTVESFRPLNDYKSIIYCVLTDTENNKTYKYFNNGILKKEYGPSYTYERMTGEAMIFSTKNGQGQKDNLYTYNLSSDAENIIPSTSGGEIEAEITGNLMIRTGRSASYYVTKESASMVFYSGISATITPYKGDKVPSYSVQGGTFSFTMYSRTYSSTTFYYFSLTYQALEKIPVEGTDAFSYEPTGETLYAYYLIDSGAVGANLIELYSGYNSANVYMSGDFEIVLVSTIDKFADEAVWGAYGSFENLQDLTIVYSAALDENSQRISLTDSSSFAASNVVIMTDKYLRRQDYSVPDTRHSVYTYDGKLVLNTKYDVTNIEGDLARVALGMVSGIFDLRKGKLLEEVRYNNVNLINGNLYAVGVIKENGMLSTLKDSKGRTIAEDCITYEYLNRTFDYANSTVTDYYSIYFGKDQFKLMAVTYKVKL